MLALSIDSPIVQNAACAASAASMAALAASLASWGSNRSTPPPPGSAAPPPSPPPSSTTPRGLLPRVGGADEDELFFGGGGSATNPRSFPYSVKQRCWEKAEKVKGRDPDRWRRDTLGNIVFRKLVGCPGCLCHDYDHIVPFSKGGKSTLENCQVLQATVNRSKGNKTEISRSDLIQKSAYCRVSGRDMDLLELSAYGNVRRAPDSGGCNIQ
uniref:HNH nuclease domain-containing protein n=1 Tax=Ananas comosus var. bracteatus TaxID=296719 RepID=A0A6V7QS52_ANACO